MDNAAVVRRFEEEFKSRANFEIVDEVMTEDFVHHLPYDLPTGRQGMKAVGHLVTGTFADIDVSIDLLLTDGDLVADRLSVSGTRNENGERTEWVENHIYRLEGGRISELWPAGGASI